MSILGKYKDKYEDKNTISNDIKQSDYIMPAVTRDDDYDSIPLKKAMWISLILHPTTVGIGALIVFILAFFGLINLAHLPEPKRNDIEFVLVDKEQEPLNKNTKYRADINSRTGGINDPKKPVSMPSSPASKPSKPSSGSSPAPKQSLLNKITQSVAPKPKNNTKTGATTPQKNVQPSEVVSKAVPKPEIAKPAPPSPKPSIRPPMNNPKIASKPTGSPFKVPVPSGGTTTGQYSTGPVSGSGSSKNGGSSGSGRYAPGPSLAPVGTGSGTKTASGTGTGSGSGTGGRGSGSGSGSGSGGGNPGGGGGRPGIDAIKEPDFGPYMRELQRRIKMNWDPPKGNESKRVVLIFKIAKDGRLLSCSVLKSSGVANADKAAISAVHAAAPFRPLPADYKGANIDIQFTFDYNVFGATKY